MNWVALRVWEFGPQRAKGKVMTIKLILLVAMTGMLFSCQSERKTAVERRTDSVEEGADRAARALREEAAEAKATLAKRLDQLDAEIDSLEARAKKATAKNRARLNNEAKEMRAEATRLRGRMSTWDDKMTAAWRTTKSEVEDGVKKTESAMKRLVDDIKD